MPVASPSAIRSVRPARKPTTSAGTAERPRPVSIVQTSPTSASTPVASMIRPIRSQTRPWRRCRSASRSASDGGVERGGEHQRRAERRLDDLAGALELGVDARVDVALRRAHDGAAARRRGARPGPRSARSRRATATRSPIASRTRSRSSGWTRTVTRSRSTSPRSAPRTASTHELRVDGDGGAQDLLGEQQRQVDGVGLQALGGRRGVLLQPRARRPRARRRRGRGRRAPPRGPRPGPRRAPSRGWRRPRACADAIAAAASAAGLAVRARAAPAPRAGRSRSRARTLITSARRRRRRRRGR